MDSILRDLLIISVYVDEILIVSDLLDEHTQHASTVLQRLALRKLYISLEKCEFPVPEIDFLAFHLNFVGVSPIPNKNEAINKYSLCQYLLCGQPADF